MRLAARHDMLDVRFPGAGEAPAGVRPVDASPHLVDDPGLHTLWIRVVVLVVWRATVFRGNRGERRRRGVGRSGSVGWRYWNVRCNGNQFRMCDGQKRLVDPAAAPGDTAEQNPSSQWVECLGIEPVPLGYRGYYGEGRPRAFSHIGPFNFDDKVRGWNRS